MVKLVADKYVAGQSSDEVLSKTKELNLKGYELTIDLLGEHVSDINESNDVTEIYLRLLDEINNQNLTANISVKPTHIGLDISLEIFERNALKLVQKASEYKNFVRFDMENSATTDDTIRVYKNINKNYKNIGTVFQAYLKRTYNDLEKLMTEKINFRLCKGIYNESENIAYKNPKDINSNYLKIVEMAFERKTYIGLATHDLYLIDEIYTLIEKHKVPKENFEFQVLYGVPMKGWLEKHLKNSYKVRIYLPYGPQWYEYSIRRLKENPNIAKYVMKSIFSKRNY